MKMDDTKKKTAGISEPQEFGIRHTNLDSVETRFINHAIVQRSPQGEFLISFFEVVPPIVLGATGEAQKESQESTIVVEAKCRGRFLFTRERIAELTTVLAKHLLPIDVAEANDKTNETSVEDEKRAG